MRNPPSRRAVRRRLGIMGVSGTVLLAACGDGHHTVSDSPRAVPEYRGHTAQIDDAAVAVSPLPRGEAVFGLTPAGTQMSVLHLHDGTSYGSANERVARPALSLIKLYIADYVLDHGTNEERELAVAMIRRSDDAIADELFDAYPNCIDDVARQYGLYSTRTAKQWGYSVTSTYDVTRFLARVLRDKPRSPLLEAMRTADPTATDGYRQDYGTATLDGVKGTKWGWSNEHTMHASVSFGEDFVVAANLIGDADALTHYVQRNAAPLLP